MATSDTDPSDSQRKTPKFKYLERRAIIPAKAPTDADIALPDLDNVQGDIYYMFPKKFEQFIFFTISDLDQFRTDLDTYRPEVTTAKQTIDNIQNIHDHPGSNLDIVSSQIAFSQAGLIYLNPKGGSSLSDPHFDNGSMEKEKSILGDMRTWDEVFQGGKVHGVILVTAGEKTTCDNKGDSIQQMFSKSIKDIVTMDGRVRNGEGEHFGWRDGISQPALQGLSVAHPGQRVVSPGVIIMGYPGDPVIDNPQNIQRPKYTKDGSFMIFRKLEQAVLSLEDYINKNYSSIPASNPLYGKDLTKKERKDLFGARMVGRFKTGAPLALTPYRDNSTYTDPSLINNFDYTTGNTDPPNCPFAAHIRKTAPRNLDPLVQKQYLDSVVIVRAGIPYGDDVTKAERDAWKKLTDEQKSQQTSPRGLLFVCYQSSIANGFFLQTTGFANNDFFPITSVVPQKHGQDPIIGGPKPVSDVNGDVSIPGEGEVTLTVTDSNTSLRYVVTGFAKAYDTSVTAYEQDFFVTSHGGEYFFVPSLSTLKAWGASQN
jgi:Dyp-type peroxidase family